MSPDILTRLASLNIHLVSETAEYCIFARGNCIAIAHRRDGGLTLGSSGMMTEAGLAYLVWRDGQPLLAAHRGSETSGRRPARWRPYAQVLGGFETQR